MVTSPNISDNSVIAFQAKYVPTWRHD